jgi:hypothetical protein
VSEEPHGARRSLRDWWGGRCPACAAPLGGRLRCERCGTALPARYAHLRRSRGPIALAATVVALAVAAGAAAAAGVFGGSSGPSPAPLAGASPATATASTTASVTPTPTGPAHQSRAPQRRHRTRPPAARGKPRTAAPTSTMTRAAPPATATVTQTTTSIVPASPASTSATSSTSEPTTATTGDSSTTTTSSTAGRTTTSTTETTPPGPQTLDLPPAAASTYAPGVSGITFGTPAAAIDGSARSAWTASLDPTADGQVGAGLLLDLGAATRPRSLTIVTGTPFMSVTVYGSSGAVPAALDDPGWRKLAADPSLRPSTTLQLRPGTQLLRQLLVWIDRSPPGVNAGRLALNEITVTSSS